MIRRKPRKGHLEDRIVAAIATWVAAVRHVASGGATTRRQATRRAQAPPGKCPTCHQTVARSPDWRDHIHPEGEQ